LPYHFANSLTAIGQASVGIAKRTRRLAQEIASLNNSLTISENSSIFVRTSEERLDVMKVIYLRNISQYIHNTSSGNDCWPKWNSLCKWMLRI
jgi:hypothetical protein